MCNSQTWILFLRMLSKRAQGRSHLVFKNYRKRFFVLTNKGLSYSKDKTKATLGRIPVSDILGAERLGEASFHMKLVRLMKTMTTRLSVRFKVAGC